MKHRWKKIRHWFEWLLLSLLAGAVPRLPRSWIVRMANFCGGMVYRFDERGRRLSLANLEAAFGERYSHSERERIARQAYQNFARTILDLFWAPALTPENYRRFMRIENADVLRRLKERGDGVIILCIHHGNFEWASLAAGFEGFPTMIVAEEFKNSRLGPIFNRCREVSGHRIIAQKSSMVRLLKQVKKGGFAGMLVDLNCKPTEAATIIDSFGMAMCATYLHAVLAQRAGARIVPMEGCSQPDGTCHIKVFEPLMIPDGADLRRITQACWDFFQPIIAAAPEQWLLAYRHWRYQPPGPQRSYPFYARSSRDFDRLYSEVVGTPSAAGSITGQ